MKECPICKQDLIPINSMEIFLECPSKHYIYNCDNEDTFFNTKDYYLITRTRYNHTVIRNLKREQICTLDSIIEFDWDKLDELNQRVKNLIPFS